jgi:hypothetical protein
MRPFHFPQDRALELQLRQRNRAARKSMASSDAKAALIQKHEVGLNSPKEIADYELQRFGIRDVQRILDCVCRLRPEVT